MIKLIEKDLSLPHLVNEADKLHRVGNVKEMNGKKSQDIIIKFKSHAVRYAVFNERKKIRGVKIRPDLTKKGVNYFLKLFNLWKILRKYILYLPMLMGGGGGH